MGDVERTIAEIRLVLMNIRRSTSFVDTGQLADTIEERLDTLERLVLPDNRQTRANSVHDG